MRFIKSGLVFIGYLSILFLFISCTEENLNESDKIDTIIKSHPNGKIKSVLITKNSVFQSKKEYDINGILMLEEFKPLKFASSLYYEDTLIYGIAFYSKDSLANGEPLKQDSFYFYTHKPHELVLKMYFNNSNQKSYFVHYDKGQVIDYDTADNGIEVTRVINRRIGKDSLIPYYRSPRD